VDSSGSMNQFSIFDFRFSILNGCFRYWQYIFNAAVERYTLIGRGELA